MIKSLNKCNIFYVDEITVAIEYVKSKNGNPRFKAIMIPSGNVYIFDGHFVSLEEEVKWLINQYKNAETLQR